MGMPYRARGCNHECEYDCCSHECSSECRHYECNERCDPETGDCYTDDDECTHTCDEDCCSHDCLDGECSDTIHNYGHKPTPIFHGKGDLYFGWELEVAFRYGTNLDEIASDIVGDEEHYYAKWDGSIGYSSGMTEFDGFELVSHPGTIEHWRKTPLNFLRRMQAAHGRSYNTPTCGMHVHVSRKPITRGMLLNILALFSNYDFVFQLSRRRDSESLDSYASPERKEGVVRKANRLYSGHRHEAINCTNSDTIEFRIFKGTLWEPSFRRNLELVNAVIHWSRYESLDATGTAKSKANSFAAWLREDQARELLGRPVVRELAPWVSACNAETVNLEA